MNVIRTSFFMLSTLCLSHLQSYASNPIPDSMKELSEKMSDVDLGNKQESFDQLLATNARLTQHIKTQSHMLQMQYDIIQQNHALMAENKLKLQHFMAKSKRDDQEKQQLLLHIRMLEQKNISLKKSAQFHPAIHTAQAHQQRASMSPPASSPSPLPPLHSPLQKSNKPFVWPTNFNNPNS